MLFHRYSPFVLPRQREPPCTKVQFRTLRITAFFYRVNRQRPQKKHCILFGLSNLGTFRPCSSGSLHPINAPESGFIAPQKKIQQEIPDWSVGWGLADELHGIPAFCIQRSIVSFKKVQKNLKKSLTKRLVSGIIVERQGQGPEGKNKRWKDG